MILGQITIENVLERYSVLPDELLAVLEDPNTEKIIETICRKNNISKKEWVDVIKQLVGYALMGFIHYYDLGAEINTELNFLNSKLGNDIASEIDAKIFNQIKNLLDKNYSPIVPTEQQEDLHMIDLQKEPETQKDSQKEQLQTEQKQEPVPFEKIIIPTTGAQQENKQPPPKSPEKQGMETAKNQKEIPPLSFMSPSTAQAPKEISQQQKESNKDSTKTQIASGNAQEKPKEVDIQQDKIQPLPPVFIHKEEEFSPIKKGVEIKPQEIKISDVKSIPIPPKPVQIEIGHQNDKEKEGSNIKIVNYSEGTVSQSGINNTNEKESLQKDLKNSPPPPSVSSPDNKIPPPPPLALL